MFVIAQFEMSLRNSKEDDPYSNLSLSCRLVKALNDGQLLDDFLAPLPASGTVCRRLCDLLRRDSWRSFKIAHLS